MKIIYKHAHLLIASLTALCVLGCRDRSPDTRPALVSSNTIKTPEAYLSLIISLDTLSTAHSNATILAQDSLLSIAEAEDKGPFYHYFRARKFALEKKLDSAMSEYARMTSTRKNDETELLKNYAMYSQMLNHASTVEASLMNKIFAGLKASERNHSKISYRYYDLVAQAYFQNHNNEKSLEYSAKYFQAHPFKNHKAIKQRYFDISFLLASRLADYNKMTYYNGQARKLARSLGDSLALARTYDNQAQIYSMKGLSDKALEASRKYFSYLKKSDNLNDIAYNNLATAFVQDGQADSAIFYYKAGIALEQKNPAGKRRVVHYQGLIDAYKLKGDYKSALLAADSVYKIGERNNRAIEAGNIAEMNEKYEVEKKDQSIKALNARNQLNEEVIRQQRWSFFLLLIIFLAAVSMFIIVYRQIRLRDRNKLLASENQRLQMEQKLLQAQLNPHFIFNAIANLQGLISAGDTAESVRYLRAFSALLRAILEQNRKDFIDIEEEISTLKNYLQLQQMRYTGAFDYRISADEELDIHQTLIPPMLIQPFIENAIEHGFRNIDYKGNLDISFQLSDDQLKIVIEDNGSGLGTKATGQQKKQSLSQTIISERFEVLFGSYSKKAHFNLIDKNSNAGTGVRVEIMIPMIIE
ncbi:histidine kinase [Pedobacter gandavensis]|uniref:histidine kinase n=1 Tax=Pedobacter gandavensis TaxID=2679963 RepID=UPI00292CC2D7|nr:histidine kinase [Pedobacter gandavensis]